MSATVEGLYSQKSILCLPIQTDQFLNSIAIDNSGVAKSLFTPPCLWQSFLKPHDFHEYTFPSHSVTTKLLTMWRNITYEQAVRIVSLEMKHAGGVRRAVEEMEFLVDLNGDLERYAPFHSTLPFYQRYMLDLVLVYFVLPITIIFIFAC
ncbi:unnamed protein product [Rotaria sp. Silwood1]|nr:unnamed protein product [Rotaria sp. Silwood1]